MRMILSRKYLFYTALIAGLLLLAWPSSAYLNAQQPDLPFAQLDSLISQVMKPAGSLGPGVALYVSRKGSTPYRKIVGQANLEYGIPLTENSIFDLASVAKQFTGLAIAKLLQSGELSLTDDVRKYLSEVPDFGTPITLAHLVYHTSGLRDVGELYGLGNFEGEFTSNTALGIVSRQKALNFTPGTEHDYSNTGYVLLAVIVERITGKTFVEWCQQNIFLPFGMESSFANDDPGRVIPDRAVAYYGVEPNYSFMQNNGMSLIGSSAVFASLNDMVKWMSIFEEENAVLRKLMTTRGRLIDGTIVDYGFGLGLGKVGDVQMVTHSGSTPAGFRTLMAYLPEQRVSIIILSNWGNLEPINDLARPIISLLLDKPANTPAKTEAASVVTVPENLLQTYAGKYLFNQERAVSIALRDGQLFAEITGMEPAALEPRSATEFFLSPMNSMLSFEVDKGKVSRVVIKEGEQIVGELRQETAAKKIPLPAGAAGSFYSEELDKVFTIRQEEGALYLVSAAHGTTRLRQLSATAFNGETDLFRKLTLQKSTAGDITGFILDLGSRARNLYFARWNPTTKK